MKTAARMSLAIVLLLVAGLILPRPATRVFTSDALAQVPLPTPTVPDILPSPTPTPTETPTPPPGDGGGGGGDGGDGGGGGNDGGIIEDGEGGGGGRGGGTGGDKGSGRKKNDGTPVPGFYHVPGSYDTEALLAVAARLRSLGWSTDRVLKKVFAPFIIGGRANWVDTWGAPRFGPGPIVRTHEGQDVFCEYGDPVLASESGTVEFDDGGLGGKVARLHRGDGYLYYAHLSGWNTREFQSGDTVEVGDVVGFCGNTGNALTTPAHVHFGWYLRNGEAKNPMRVLVRWLREAEMRAAGLAGNAENKRLQQIASLTTARRFGDAFSPDLSELKVSGESLWAAGSSPAASALSLAESALQAALAGSTFGSGAALQSSALGAGDGDDERNVAMDPAAQLGRLSGAERQPSFGEHAD